MLRLEFVSRKEVGERSHKGVKSRVMMTCKYHKE